MILAIVAVLCVAVYVLVDNARFKEAKPEIEQAVRQYMEEIKTVNLAAPQERIARTQELLENTGRNLRTMVITSDIQRKMSGIISPIGNVMRPMIRRLSITRRF